MYKTSTVQDLKCALQEAVQTKKTIGFVPTMGALHKGHISLIEKAKEQCDFVVCSIFVNPTQFNNPIDLEKYPSTLEKDIELLSQVACDFVFVPSVNEIYPNYPGNTKFIELDLQGLDKVMEGASRPGHFDGVVNVVYRLFDIVQPHYAFFGQKDFQQLCIIKHMVKSLKLPVQIIEIPTLREISGLAMSSRNMRLSEQQRDEAALLYKVLSFGKENFLSYSPFALRNKMAELFAQGTLQLDYLEIVEPIRLQNLSNKWMAGAQACIAAYCGEVRLIDNVRLID